MPDSTHVVDAAMQELNLPAFGAIKMDGNLTEDDLFAVVHDRFPGTAGV